MIVGCRRDLIINLVDQLGMPFQRIDRFGHINRFAIINRLAAIKAFHHRQITRIAGNQLGKADQHRLAVTGVLARPTPILKRGARLFNRQINVRRITGGNMGQGIPRCRINRGKGFARNRRAIAAVDKGTIGQIQPMGNCGVFVFCQQTHIHHS